MFFTNQTKTTFYNPNLTLQSSRNVRLNLYFDQKNIFSSHVITSTKVARNLHFACFLKIRNISNFSTSVVLILFSRKVIGILTTIGCRLYLLAETHGIEITCIQKLFEKNFIGISCPKFGRASSSIYIPYLSEFFVVRFGVTRGVWWSHGSYFGEKQSS